MGRGGAGLAKNKPVHGAEFAGEWAGTFVKRARVRRREDEQG